MSRFDHVKYDEIAQAAQIIFKDVFENFCRVIETLPDGRAKRLALTKLEESYMWVGKAIRDDQIEREKEDQYQRAVTEKIKEMSNES